MFLQNLSQNLLETLNDDDEFYDIIIEVGDDLYKKIFQAHMVILNYRSPYFRRILSPNEKSNRTLKHNIKLQNILPETFQIILKYIYCGRLSLEKDDTLNIINVLIAASKLELQELIIYLQSFLIKNKAYWLEQNFDFIYQMSFKDDSFLELQRFCADLTLISGDPDKLFKSPNFSSIPEKLLVSLIQNKNLQMSEIQVWEHIIEWGLNQNPGLPSDPTNYSEDDLNSLKNTLRECIPFVKFHNLSSKEFLEKVLPYKKILPKELYKNLLNEFLKNDYRPISSRFTDSEKINSRNVIVNSNSKNIILEKIDSKIISNHHVELISKWIDRLDIADNLISTYKFKLIFRGSRDGLTPKKFHEFCDNKPRTLIIAKVENSDEILGGYNPIIWKSERIAGSTKDSFIFSFKDGKHYDMSRITNEKDAINNGPKYGPSFGNEDLHLYRSYLRDGLLVYCNYDYKRTSYEKPIREGSGFVGRAKELEVFEVV